MPQRVITHIRKHPRRLAVTLFILAAAGWGVAGWALVQSFDAAHQGRVENCIAVNELSRKIYITLADFKVPMPQRAKYLPTENCETLP